jgi:hypothetical protein
MLRMVGLNELLSAENLVLSGRAEQATAAHALASSYACANCCPVSAVGVSSPRQRLPLSLPSAAKSRGLTGTLLIFHPLHCEQTRD